MAISRRRCRLAVWLLILTACVVVPHVANAQQIAPDEGPLDEAVSKTSQELTGEYHIRISDGMYEDWYIVAEQHNHGRYRGLRVARDPTVNHTWSLVSIALGERGKYIPFFQIKSTTGMTLTTNHQDLILKDEDTANHHNSWLVVGVNEDAKCNIFLPEGNSPGEFHRQTIVLVTDDRDLPYVRMLRGRPFRPLVVEIEPASVH